MFEQDQRSSSDVLRRGGGVPPAIFCSPNSSKPPAGRRRHERLNPLQIICPSVHRSAASKETRSREVF